MSPESHRPSAPAPEAVPVQCANWRQLEARLARIEHVLGLPAWEESGPEQVPAATAREATAVAPDAQGIESEIGEFWLARVGVVALIVGLGFLVVYPFAGFPAWLPSLIGYAATAGLLGLARLWSRSLPDTARILFGGALFLLYFATLRLHFFSAVPAVESRALVLALVGVVLAVLYVVAWRRRSELTALLATVLVLATGVVGNVPLLAFALGTAAALVSVWLYRRLDWWRLGLTAVLLVYATHLNWLLGNPLLGQPAKALAESHSNLLFLLAAGAAFVSAGLLRPQEDEPAVLRILRALFSGGGLLVLGLLNARLYHAGEPPWVQAALGVLFLGAATAYWWHHRGRFGTAIYACLGYMSLSFGIMAWFPSPEVYSWLAWQSLLVAATAVWFQSKIIIVANLFICGGIFAAYLLMARAAGSVSLSFAIVALLTARVLNWQKDRLNLRTELMRSIYLAAATIIIPYGLYHVVPKSLVSTAWLLAAGAYFAASIVLANRKYRMMAMATIFATVGYVFIVDLSRLEAAYRIVSFLVLGVGLIALSIYYARMRRKETAARPEVSEET